ncbi:MAG: hypothetical protein HOE90_12385 [Bacteriovoracaceae bacterium]|nr:hypothetical protein [Bacteriovoracaceae bacterium]
MSGATAQRKRLEKFLKKCRAKSMTKKLFRNGFEVAGRHINKGIIKDPMRSSFNHEDMAAIISMGCLNLANSSEGPPMEIAIEGKFLDFEWINWTEKGSPLVTEDAVHARIVIKEASKKDIIITIYAWKVDRSIDVPEIDRNVW